MDVNQGSTLIVRRIYVDIGSYLRAKWELIMKNIS